MAQCQSPEELMKLISRIVDAMVNQYLLCGTLQGGLVACGEDAYLPKDTEVVLCRQLHELVQEGIDTGKIVAPTVVEVRYEGSKLILHLANGENLELDLKPLIDGVIDQAFVDCDGQAIHVGTALATCANLEAVKIALENKLSELDQKVDHNKELTDQEIQNTKELLEQQIATAKELLEQQIAANKELSDQADDALNKRIDDWILDITERMKLLDESITNKIDAATAEWANTVLKELIELFLDTRQVYHDDSLEGDGHEAAPLKVNVEWLRAQIASYLPEVVKFKDCCGNDINIGDVLVTCECLDTQLKLLANELKAYAESEDAKILAEAKEYADAGDAATLTKAKEYTDEQIGILIDQLPQLILNVVEAAGYIKRIYTDTTLVGEGTAASPVGVNLTWLKGWFDDQIGEVIKFIDCDGNRLSYSAALVTCEQFNSLLAILNGGTAGQVLTSNGDGTFTWKDLPKNITAGEGVIITDSGEASVDKEWLQKEIAKMLCSSYMECGTWIYRTNKTALPILDGTSIYYVSVKAADGSEKTSWFGGSNAGCMDFDITFDATGADFTLRVDGETSYELINHASGSTQPTVTITKLKITQNSTLAGTTPYAAVGAIQPNTPTINGTLVQPAKRIHPPTGDAGSCRDYNTRWFYATQLSQPIPAGTYTVWTQADDSLNLNMGGASHDTGELIDYGFETQFNITTTVATSVIYVDNYNRADGEGCNPASFVMVIVDPQGNIVFNSEDTTEKWYVSQTDMSCSNIIEG